MGYTRAVGILHRKELASAPDDQRKALHARAEHERIAGGVNRAMAIGVVTKSSTRPPPARRLAAAPAGRGAHGNIRL